MDDPINIKALIDKWGEAVVHYLPRLFLAILVVLGFYFLARILKKYSRKFYSKIFKSTHQIATIISLGIYVFFVLSGIFLALEILGLESTLAKLLAGAGVVGIVAGFALKDIASNAFAGFLLKMQRPFAVGDWVSINSSFGTVHRIGPITTSINNITGQEVFVPNQLIYNSTFTNYSTFGKRRVILSSGVSYGDELEFVKTAAMEEAQKLQCRIKEEEVEFYYTEIGSSTYNFELRFWIKFEHQKDYLSARSEIILAIKKRFEKENISIAYSVVSLDFGVKGGTNIFEHPLRTES